MLFLSLELDDTSGVKKPNNLKATEETHAKEEAATTQPLLAQSKVIDVKVKLNPRSTGKVW